MAKRTTTTSRGVTASSRDENKGLFKRIAGKVGRSISNAIGDFTTLEVTTLTGNISQIDIKKTMSKEVLMEAENNDSTNAGNEKIKKEIYKLNLEDLLDSQSKKEIHVVAHTKIHFDHDTINFVSSNADHQDLFELHLDAVRTANDSRNGFLGLLQKAIV